MFEARDISPRVGTEIKISKADLTSGKYAGDIEDLLKTHSALVFREMFLEDGDAGGTRSGTRWGGAQRLVYPEPSYADLLRWRTRPSQTHPLVWHHAESGLKSLVLGVTAYYVHDMSREDSDALLCRMQEWATQEKYVYRHKWGVGDFLVWDNTGTMHRADTYSLDSKRLMHRTTLEGEEALG